jgi:phage terminase large subunit
MTTNEIEFSYKFEPLFNLLNKDFHPEIDTVIMTGGRFSSKSYVASIFSTIALTDYQWDILYTRYTSLSIVDSVKPEVSDKLELLGKQYLVNDTKTHIECGKNRIAFKGIKTGSQQQTANLKSLSGFNCFVVDEAEELPDLKTFKKVFYSIRSPHRRNLTILILNPTTKNHWIYREFFEGRNVTAGWNGIKDNVCYIHTSFKDVNPDFIPDNIIADYERLEEDNPKEYDNIVAGGWITEPDGVLLPISRLKFIHPKTVKPEFVEFSFAVGDPANTGGDSYAMAFIKVMSYEGKLQFFVSDVVYSGNGIESLSEPILDKLRHNACEECYLEVNGLGLAAFLLLKSKIENHISIKGFQTTENKEVKILSNYEFIQKNFTFRSDYKEFPEYNKFIDHLTGYMKDEPLQNKHKMDAIDCLSMGAKVAKAKYKSVLYG